MLPPPTSATERKRLINAAHRLAKISQENPAKLFSLLYMLDIRLFRETGKSCTGETYYAMADGPAPGSLRPLLAMRGIGLDPGIGVLTASDPEGPWPFEPHHYCPRSLAILGELESSHRETPFHALSLGDGNAWWRVYTQYNGIGAAIPYEMTVCGAGLGLGKAAERKPAPRQAPRAEPPLMLIPFLAGRQPA